MRNNDWVGKRTAVRQNCQMRGEMRFINGQAPRECIIVDISASGCRVLLPDEAEVPEDFDLYIPSRSETKIAKVRRQEGVNLGVAFLKSRLDDPLVMQTLLERVLRLERGYNEIKGFYPRPDELERRDGNDRRLDGESEATVEGSAGPLLDDRLKALASGLQEVRLAVDTLCAAPVAARLDGVVGQAAKAASDVATLKIEMNALAKAMRDMTAVSHGDVTANHVADIIEMKAEMSRLSVVMREIADQVMRTGSQIAPRSGQSATVEAAETLQMARMRADIAQLRAAVDTQQASAASLGQVPAGAHLDLVWRELNDLRQSMQSARDKSVDADSIHGIKADVARLQASLEAGMTGADPRMEVRSLELAGDVAMLKTDQSALGEAMRQMTGKAYPQSPAFSAELAEMKAGMLTLSASMGEMAAEMPKVHAFADAGLEPAKLASVRRDIEDLRTALDGLSLREAPAASSVQILDDVNILRTDLTELSASMRQLTSKAFAEAPTFSADLAEMKAEMLTLSVAMREMSAEMPKVQAFANAGLEPVQITSVKAEVAELRAALAAGSLPVAAGPHVVQDVAKLKTDLMALGDAMRGLTSKAYADAPAYSADLAHMKAEMLSLSAAMRDMTDEMPKIQKFVDSGVDVAQISRLTSDIAQLRVMLKAQPAGGVAAPSEDLTELRASVQTLILLVSQSLQRSPMAA